jgi:hypothetical protein
MKAKKISLLTLLILLFLVCPLIVNAAILTYPGPTPCDTTLQNCIDAAGAGNTVEIATNGPIDESLDLNKSLILKAAMGFTPTLAEDNSIVASSGGNTDNAFTIQGITLKRGEIFITHSSTGSLNVYILNNVIEESWTTPSGSILISSGTSGPPKGKISFSIQNNKITVPEDIYTDTNGIAFGLYNCPEVTGDITGNTIVHHGCSQCAGIFLPNGNQTLTVDVMGNTISGTNYDAGISLFQYDSDGTINSRIINNVITGQSGNVGWPAAISVDCDEGTCGFSIVNNTLSDNRYGILIGGRKDLGAVMNGVVVNNIVANNQRGVSIGSDFTSTVTNSYNLIFNNDNNYFIPGPRTINTNPQFVGGGNYRLLATSPAVNAGNKSAVPADITKDLDGNPRIISFQVDMGAYELQQLIPEPSAKCRTAQLAAQDAVKNGGPYKNAGQKVKTASHAANPYLYSGDITEECHSCIVSQFARKIPIDKQQSCGSDFQACCHPYEWCADAGAESCIAWGGTPMGNGTNCATTTCPTQACCIVDYLFGVTCEDHATMSCEIRGGVPKGEGTDCATTTCQLQACCYDTGEFCYDWSADVSCPEGGTPMGGGSKCLGDGNANGKDDACEG